ncbi:PHP domain-containing protein [Candidatus Woesearchaeota archaeon]|nr:PHP domain-containing protein [Candidatus Woesearchaeota archaeon]
MLKADLHLHAKEDIRDAVKYTVKELIDHMASKGFQVIALTFHDQSYNSEEMNNYAKSKGILIIPGIERTIKGRHVLIYNLDHKKAEEIKDFEDLKKIKNENVYTLIDSKQDINSIIKAIKSNKVQLVTKPLPFSVFFKTLFYMIFLSPIKTFKRRK